MGYMRLQSNLYSIVSFFSKPGHENVVFKLIQAGADINIRTDGGATALHLASYSGQSSKNSDNSAVLEIQSTFLPFVICKSKPLLSSFFLHLDSENIVATLLEVGADVNAGDDDYYTSLHVVAYMGYENIVDLLVYHRVDVCAQSSDDTTALHFASENPNNGDIVEFLVYLGADVNATDADNWTPLHYAAQNGSIDAAKILIANQANINAITVNAETPILFAAANGKYFNRQT